MLFNLYDLSQVIQYLFTSDFPKFYMRMRPETISQHCQEEQWSISIWYQAQYLNVEAAGQSRDCLTTDLPWTVVGKNSFINGEDPCPQGKCGSQSSILSCCGPPTVPLSLMSSPSDCSPSRPREGFEGQHLSRMGTSQGKLESNRS